MKQLRILGGRAALMLATLLLVAAPASALVGAHSYTNTTTGDVFLGGDYIELGIAKAGSFGTATGQSLPPNFFGTAGRNNIGMSTNPTGFGVAPDLRMDFFLPGTPEERWDVGYKQSGTPTTGTNSLLASPVNISNNVETNESSGNLLKSDGIGTLNNKLQITQDISFESGDKFFLNQVTLKNVGASQLDSVRYMRSFDPDNTVFQGGAFETHDYIPYTAQAGDGKSVVVADTNQPGITDPVFLINGSYSPILFYSSDSRARVSTFGFQNTDPYAASAYDSALPKGTDVDADQAISIDFDVGTLQPGDAQTVSYYTSLDNRDFSTVLNEIQASQQSADDDGDNVANSTENAAPNSGDANGDGIQDSTQSNVSSLPNPVVGGGAYEALQTGGACNNITQVEVKPSSDYKADGSYAYPLGLTDYSVSCTSPGGTAAIKIFYDKVYNTSGWVLRKYLNGAYVTVPSATFGTATVGSKTVTTLSYNVTDGGPLDADGTANGTIVDPAGPAIADAPLNTVTSSAPNTGFGRPAVMSRLTLAAALTLPIVIVIAGYSYWHISRRR